MAASIAIALITIVTKVTLSETPSVVTLLEKRELDPGGQVCLLSCSCLLLVHVDVSQLKC